MSFLKMESQTEVSEAELEEELTGLVDTTLRLEYELELAVKSKE